MGNNNSLFGDETHVTDLRIFKSHGHDDHHEFMQVELLFQVTEYRKTNRNVIPHRKSVLATVPFGISPSQLSSQDGLFDLVFSVCSKFDSMFFIDSKRLAEKITAKIMSRFSFITTTSCSNLIIAVNVDILCKTNQIRIRFPRPILEMLHDGVSSSFNHDEEDMDDDDDDNDDHDDDNDENNSSQITTEFPHQNLEFDHDAVSSSFNNDEEVMALVVMDDDDGQDDDDNDENNSSQITTEFPHQNLEFDHDAVSSSFNNDEEVMAIVVMDDDDGQDDDDNDENNSSQITTEFPHQNLEFDHDAVSSSFNHDEEDMDDDDDDNDDHDDDNEDNEVMDDDDGQDDDDNDEYDNSFSGFEEDFFSNIKGFSEVTGLVDVKPQEVLNSTDCCSICLEEYGSDFSRVAKAETSVCSHMFHKDCIRPWLRKSSNTCPLCRSVFIARI